MRIFLALILGGTLAVVGCSSDGDGSAGSGGNGGSGGTAGSAGSGGAGGTGDGSPTITMVVSTPNPGCTQGGGAGDYTITVTAMDDQDLTYGGSPPTGCGWAAGSNDMFDGNVATWNCANAADYPDAVVNVTDTDNNTDEVTFTVLVCRVATVTP